MDGLPLSDGPLETSDLADFHAIQYLTGFPPEFVGLIGLEGAFVEHVAVLLAEEITRQTSGRVGVTGIRHDEESRKTFVYVQDRSKEPAETSTFVRDNPRVVANRIVLRRIADRVASLGDADLSTKISHAEAVGELPPDILKCLNSAADCRLAICALAKLSWSAAMRPSVTAVESINNAISRLKLARFFLSESLKTVGPELAGNTIAVGSRQFVSVHDGVLWLSGRTVDCVALSGSTAGQMLYASMRNGPFVLEPRRSVELLYIAAALTRLPIDDLSIAALQNEALRAARLRKIASDPGSPIEILPKLSPGQEKALAFIREKGPVKAILIAKHAGVKESTFRTHWLKKLSKHGVQTDGDGYYVKSI